MCVLQLTYLGILLFSATEIQNIQIADGNVVPNF